MGKTAEKLLKLLDEYKGNTRKLLSEHKELAYLYALSDARENLLEWFPFKKSGSLLQIGADGGALTGLYSRKVAQVVVLDEDITELHLVEKHWSKAGNLRYMNVGLEDFVAKSSKKFDYVMMIGSLKEPIERQIALAKQTLMAGGTLIVAADNPVGLKHWAGAPIEETAVGKPRLLELLEEPGAPAEVYYPLPDYKMPSEIYSDHYLPGKGDLTGTVIAYDYPEFLKADIGASYDTICEEGQFENFANSYLMVWRKHGGN